MSAQLETILESSVDIKLAEEAIKLAKARARWSSCREFYAPIISAFQRLGSEPYLSDDHVTIMLTGDKDKLAAAFRILRGAGFKFSAERPKKGDSQWYSFFTHPDCETRCFFQFTSSVCRRVKVGTEMRPVDIYETQCGDISMDEPSPALTIVGAPESVSFDQEIPF